MNNFVEDYFGLCTVSDVFASTLTAKTYFHIEQMIREDKDRHAESTKQKAAFVFASEEPLHGSDPCLSLNQR